LIFDLKLALRGIWRSPGFAISAILILALGVGANTGAFSAIHALLLAPLPYPHPEGLVTLYETSADQKPRGVAEANLLDWRARSDAFAGMAALQPRTFGLTLSDRDAVQVIHTAMVMSDFFRVLSVPPAMGRTFSEAEEFRDEHLIVLTDWLWRTKFGSGEVLGRKVYLNEEPHTIIGVMPAGFEFPTGTEALIPLSHRDYCCGRIGVQAAIARVRPEVGLVRASSQLQAAAAGLAKEFPETNRGRSAGMRRLDESLTESRREPLLLLAGAAFLLLVIASANVAGLLVARCLGRSHEMAIRAALGAGTARIARQFVMEAAVLSMAGAGLGLYAARVVLRLVPEFVSGAGELELDARAFCAAMLLAMVVTMALAAAPTLMTRSAQLGLRKSRSGFRNVLVVTQVALSVTLLLSSGLLMRSFYRLLALDPGFEVAHAMTFGIGLPEKRYDTTLKEIAYHEALTRKLAELPGVESVAAAARLPLRGGMAKGLGSFQIWGAGLPARQWPRALVNAVTPDYFRTMGIRVAEGREFSWRDDRPPVRRAIVVNAAFAREYLQARRALGTVLEVRGAAGEIVGVVGDTRQADFDREPVPEIFLSVSQVGLDGGSYVVRGAHVNGLAVAKAVAEQDPRVQRVSPRPLEGLLENVMGSRRAAIQLIGGFGLVALLLTAVGVYGVVAFRAAERRKEMAIRSALGASAVELRRLVVGHGLRVVLVGTLTGVGVFWWTAPLWRSQVFGVGRLDWLSAAVVIAVVLIIGIVGSLGPARRAASADPSELMRVG